MAVIISEKFDRALQYASIVHGGQMRRHAQDVPYIAHILGVASIALEYGADEDEAVAALLHDAAEDAGGEDRINDICSRFGEKVAEIVAGCTDTGKSPEPSWRTRKAAYIAHLPFASASVRFVSSADKLCNARSILKDLRLLGNSAWEHFNGGKDGTLWYYRCLVQAFKAAGANPIVEELERAVLEIEGLAKTLENGTNAAAKGGKTVKRA